MQINDAGFIDTNAYSLSAITQHNYPDLTVCILKQRKIHFSPQDVEYHLENDLIRVCSTDIYAEVLKYCFSIDQLYLYVPVIIYLLYYTSVSIT